MAASIPAVELHTPRLLLRPLELSDAQQTQLLFPHWEIVKHLNAIVPWPYPPDGALTFYRDIALPAIERGDEWHWTLRLRESPEKHIGAISLHRAISLDMAVTQQKGIVQHRSRPTIAASGWGFRGMAKA